MTSQSASGADAGTEPARDARLAGFAKGGVSDTCPPGPELAALVAQLSGPRWRCPGATDDELIGLLGRWAALESWAAAAKMGVVREMMRRGDQPWLGSQRHGDLPDTWDDSLDHELAAALGMAAQTANKLAWLAWELQARLPGIGARLADGTITNSKARAVAEELAVLSDDDAAQAEALILDKLAGKTQGQITKLAAQAACTVDPDGAQKRRERAEKEEARVRFWREQHGAAALAGYGLPTDEALAAHANVNARADEYKKSKAFPDAKMDQLRVLAYLDLINGVRADTRIAHAQAKTAAEAGLAPDGQPGPQTGDTHSDGAVPDDGGDDLTDDAPDTRDSDTNDPGTNDPGTNDPGTNDAGTNDPGTNDPGMNAPGTHDPVSPSGPSGPHGPGGPDGPSVPGGGSASDCGDCDPAPTLPALAARANLTIPLETLQRLANRPSEGYGLGPLDPALARDLAATAARSPRSEWCVTVTDEDGFAVGHGCARPGSARPASKSPATTHAPPQTPAPWAFTPRDGPDPPDGYGTWTLTLPGGKDLTVKLGPVPTHACDHRHESHAYEPSDTLRHLVQIRDGECTFPPCSRHARESDFEHAIPYDKGGRTCACNAGARSRKCHRVKQSKGWNVTQPRPGWHEWTTPSGRTYTQGPKQYPA